MKIGILSRAFCLMRVFAFVSCFVAVNVGYAFTSAPQLNVWDTPIAEINCKMAPRTPSEMNHLSCSSPSEISPPSGYTGPVPNILVLAQGGLDTRYNPSFSPATGIFFYTGATSTITIYQCAIFDAAQSDYTCASIYANALKSSGFTTVTYLPLKVKTDTCTGPAGTYATVSPNNTGAPIVSPVLAKDSVLNFSIAQYSNDSLLVDVTCNFSGKNTMFTSTLGYKPLRGPVGGSDQPLPVEATGGAVRFSGCTVPSPTGQRYLGFVQNYDLAGTSPESIYCFNNNQ